MTLAEVTISTLIRHDCQEQCDTVQHAEAYMILMFELMLITFIPYLYPHIHIFTRVSNAV
jgi:hypothetical protein